jgi:hypothetical protein
MKISATAPRRLTAIESPCPGEFMDLAPMTLSSLTFNFCRSAQVTNFILIAVRCKNHRPLDMIATYDWAVNALKAIGIQSHGFEYIRAMNVPTEQPFGRLDHHSLKDNHTHQNQRESKSPGGDQDLL